METPKTKVAYIFQTTNIHQLGDPSQTWEGTFTHLQYDERRVVQLEERKGRGGPEPLDGQRRLQRKMEQEYGGTAMSYVVMMVSQLLRGRPPQIRTTDDDVQRTLAGLGHSVAVRR